MARPPGDPAKRMYSMTMAITQNQRKLLAKVQADVNSKRVDQLPASLSAIIRGCIRHTLASELSIDEMNELAK